MPAWLDPVVLIGVVVAVAAIVVAIVNPKLRPLALGVLAAAVGYIGLRALSDWLRPGKPLPPKGEVPNLAERKDERSRLEGEAERVEEAKSEIADAGEARTEAPELTDLEKRAAEAARRRRGEEPPA